MRLLVRMKGCGLRSLEDRRQAKYIGGVLQGIPMLLTSVDVNNVTLTRRLNSVGMQEWLGHNSFIGNPNIDPWEVLVGHGNVSLIYQGIHASWGHIPSNLAGIFEEIGEDAKDVIDLATNQDVTDLTNNPVNKASFDATYKIHSWLVTHTLTIDIENMRSQALKKG